VIRAQRTANVLALLWIAGAAIVAAGEQRTGDSSMKHATGTFEVRLAPLESILQDPDAEIGRMSIDKTFEGDLVGTSRGEMLTGGSPAEGSAGYVAIERVRGTLDGKSGSFLLQHSGTMRPGSRELSVTVIPGSGTGELAEIEGSMTIEISDGEHGYTFEYALPRRE
jgi:hypothetical protein